jgi:TetR/AcrR family transcriptional regulator, regulator of cefoperazone and chloramphenicol sensitivity
VARVVQQRLLDIAIREFGQKGLEGASTRSIASAAGTAMSSITYHYGGKEGLYLAVADSVAERMCREMQPFLDQFEQAAESPAAARTVIHQVLARLVEKMSSDYDADAALFISREQMNPSDAFDRIYGGTLGQMFERLANLVCVATGRKDARAARVATITLFGQAIVLRASRASCLRLLGKPTFDDESRGWFAAQIASNTDAILDRLAEAQETI